MLRIGRILRVNPPARPAAGAAGAEALAGPAPGGGTAATPRGGQRQAPDRHLDSQTARPAAARPVTPKDPHPCDTAPGLTVALSHCTGSCLPRTPGHPFGPLISA